MAAHRFLWLLALPIAVCGWLAAHAVAYALVGPHAGHGHELATGVHGYLGGAPIFIACAITLVLTGLLLAARDGAVGRSAAPAPVWPTALVPPVGFVVQEHLERLIDPQAAAIGTAADPTFLVGLALQLPMAAVCVLLARAILLLGHTLGRELHHPLRAPKQAWAAPAPVVHPLPPVLARAAVLAGGRGERAPPIAA